MKYTYFYIIVLLLVSTSCSEFLDMKPDQKMAVPKTLEHCDLLLNDYSTMNMGYPSLGEIASDDYFLRSEDWNSIYSYDEQQTYIWQAKVMTLSTQWQNPYRVVYISNQILEVLRDINRNTDRPSYDRIRGGAHFYRAFAFHQLASVFTLPYQEGTAELELGIPLRLDPAIDYKSVRASLKDTYRQIIADYESAIANLPVVEPFIGRPGKAAAYAGLARVYLDMQDYVRAYNYADSSLQLHSQLIDFKDLDSYNYAPIPRFNQEVLFPSVSVYSSQLGQTLARVDSGLYNSYELQDYRRAVFFQQNDFDADTYFFKGSYDNTDAYAFVGLTTAEVFLIRAESAARTGKIDEALFSINALARMRYRSDSFVPYIERNPDRLLSLILGERRKELVFRGLRWTDLKRLNLDSRFRMPLVRLIDGVEYRLEPNSLHYGHLIPDLVITESGISQNKR